MTQETFKENVKNLEIRDKEGNLRLKQVPLFEEQFPSLKGYTCKFDFADENEGDRIKPVSSGMFFGSLIDEGDVVHIYDVQKHCLDKQKVREIIDELKFPDRFGDTIEQVKESLKERLGL